MILIDSLLKCARSTGYGAKLYSNGTDNILHAVLVGEVPNGTEKQNMVQKCIIKDVNPRIVLHEFFDPNYPNRTENHRKSYDRLCELNKEIEGRLLPLDIPHVDLQMLQANLMELYTYFEEASTAVLEQKVIEDSILLRQRQIGRRIKTSIHSHGIPILAILSSEHIAPNSKIYDELSSYQKSRPFDFVVINQDSQLQRRLNTHPAFFQ